MSRELGDLAKLAVFLEAAPDAMVIVNAVTEVVGKASH